MQRIYLSHDFAFVRYEIMMKCWKDDPDERPTFTDLRNQLKGMETSHKRLIDMQMYDNELYGNVEDLVE